MQENLENKSKSKIFKEYLINTKDVQIYNGNLNLYGQLQRSKIDKLIKLIFLILYLIKLFIINYKFILIIRTIIGL